jgi:nicotinamide riboside kinase
VFQGEWFDRECVEMAVEGVVLVLLGAESTGKSWLADALCRDLVAEGHDAVRVTEYLREFSDHHGRTPRAHEQAAIAREQTQRIALAAREHAIVVADTSALMTAIYSACLFDDPSLLAPAIATQRSYAASLLTALDLPWVADGHQRDGPAVRQAIDSCLRATLLDAGLAFSVIHGRDDRRLSAARAAIKTVLHPAPLDRDAPRWRWRCAICDGDPGLRLSEMSDSGV